MFGGTKLYEVYVKKDSSRPLEDIVIVSQGFNIWAFIFHFFWAIYNKLWSLALLFLVFISFEALSHQILSDKSGIFFSLFFLLVKIWIAFEAHNFKARLLRKKGYVLYDIVTGGNETEAEKRFFDKYVFFKAETEGSAV